MLNKTEIKILQKSKSRLRALACQGDSKPHWYKIRKDDMGNYIMFGGRTGFRVNIQL
jgi:hypothetical protein